MNEAPKVEAPKPPGHRPRTLGPGSWWASDFPNHTNETIYERPDAVVVYPYLDGWVLVAR